MQRHKKDQIEWLTFDILSAVPKLHHAIFLRHGGASQHPYSSLNFDYGVGDNPAHVDENYARISRHLATHLGWKRVVRTRACHRDGVALIDDESENEIIDHDGLISNSCGITLLTKHADCQVALFYDPINHASASVHCGWRGSVKNIYAKAIKQMELNFGTQPSNLLVGISPSLGPEEGQFINYRTELPKHFWNFQVRPHYFDFWAISEHQLQEAGVLFQHIEIARISPYFNTHDFFSYRREKIRGCNATCITLL